HASFYLTQVLDIKAVPPLPLYALFEADNDSVAGAGTGSQSGAGADASGGLLNGGANDLFDNAFGDETSLPDTYSHNLLEAEEDDELEAGDGDSPKSPRTQRRVTSTVHQQQGGNRTAFGPATAKLLTEHLMQIQLPGLSRLDQMYLLALAEVVANLQTGLGSDWQPKTGARLASLDDGSVRGYTSTEGSVRGLTDSLDACGLRFFVVLQHHTYLLRTLPPSQRAELAQNGIAAGNLVWAFHSEAQEELLSRDEAVRLRLVVRNDSLLRRCAERAAKAAFQSKQEPLDAAVFYLAMRRVKVIAALYKTVSNQKLQDFFRQDFSQERWRTAALKNAFDLLGKQRFEHAAAFFLLGNSVKDAVEVCVTKLNDLQLAIVLARLHAAEGVLVSNSNQPLADLLNKYVLSPTGRYYSNPFYRSMAHWLLKDYDQAVSTLLLGEPDSALLDQSSLSVFNYFNYLKCHPLILRQAKLRGGLPVGMGGGGATAAVPTAASSASGERMSLTERRLFFRTAHAYFRLGCPSLALEVLTRLPDYLRLETPAGKAADGEQQQAEQPPPPPPPPAKEEDNFLCWNDIGTAADADDDRPPSLRLSSSSDEDIDDDEAMIDKKEAGALENGEAPVDDAPTGELRFVACQRIMSEELSTLATGFEVDGAPAAGPAVRLAGAGETALLRRLCHYGCTPGEEEDSAATITTVASAAAAPGYGGRKASLVDLGGSLHSRLDSWQRRKLWLRDNEQLLRTLLSFCSLHGASGGGLTSVRMELVLLLQELLQDNLTDAPLQLEAKMPLPNSLPLINAAVSSFKTVVADPIRQLQNLIGDVLGQLRRWASPPELPANAQELFLLRSISAAVSACVYQCLTVSGRLVTPAAAAGFTTSLVYGDYYCLMSRLAGQRTDALSQGAQQQQLGALRDAAVYAYAQEDLEAPNTQPSKWPGIAHLRSLLERHKDDDVPRLNIILTEAFLSVYLATLSYGLTTANAKILHRLVARSLTTSVWGAVFGGGLKTPQRRPPMRISGSPAGSGGHALSSGVVIAGGGASPRARHSQQQQQQLSAGGIPRVTDEMSKQRVKLYLSTVQGGGPPPLPPRLNRSSISSRRLQRRVAPGGGGSRGFTERFVQPRASILGCLLAKLPPDPRQPAGQAADFDSANVSENDDADDDTQDDEHAEAAPDEIPGFGGSMADLDADRSYRSSRQMRQTPAVSRRRQAAQERREYAWLLNALRLCPVGRFLPQVGLELSDLPVESPALYNAVKRVHQWQRAFRDRLRRIGQPPDGFLGGGNSSFVGEDSTFQPARLLMERYKLLLDAERTPFPGQSLSERLCNRLWAQLVRKEAARDVFAKFAFPPPPMSTTSSQQQQQKSAPPRPPPPTLSSAELTEAAPAAAADLPVALVHDTKGEAISSFCLSRANQNCLTLATSKELVELDICDLMLHPFSPAGLDDEDYGGLASATVAGAGGFVGDAVGQLDSDQLPRLLTSFAVPGVTPVPTPLFQRHQGLAGQAHYASLFAEAATGR
uniref:Rav1p_C domain-containing protein n=1 Tax=Macrostomum lignano TaxID=282301 RepID=A0A1I8FCF9_9PLAT